MFYPELLNGVNSFDTISKEDVTPDERAAACILYKDTLTFYNHYSFGLFQISYSEYERFPSVVFDGLIIFKNLYAQYRKSLEK